MLSPQSDPPEALLSPPSDRLESWKEIADYLGKGVTTVRRWERDEGLPVHRLEHLKRGSVVAYRAELDAWAGTRMSPVPGQPAEAQPGLAASLKKRWPSAALAVSGAIAAVLGLAALAARQPGQHPATELHSVALTSDPGLEGAPSLSPDGTLVVYDVSTKGEEGLFVKPVTGGIPVRLTLAPANGADVFPRWSPDGSSILFIRSLGKWLDLMLVPAHGGSARLLLRRERPATPNLRVEWASWMPGAKAILMRDKSAPDAPWSLFRYEIETGRRTRLTNPPAGTFGDLVAAASPDGRRIAFSRHRTGTEGDIYVAPATGGEPQRLTRDSAFHMGIAWQPGGEWLIYSATRLGGGPGLWTIRADGSSPAEPLPGSQSDASWPAIAAASREPRIVYQRSFEAVSIRRWDDPGLPGSRPRNVAESSRYERAAQYSPDGKMLAFSSTASSRRGSREIWVSGADGRGLRQLTWMNRPFADSPRWAPDGARIAFSNADGDNRDIYIVELAGGALRRLTTEPSEEGRPSWSRDGKWIYFRSTRSGPDQIWKKAADGTGEAVAVTKLGGYEGFESPDGRWLYYAKERHREGLWRIPTSGEGSEEQTVDRVREGLWSVASDGLYFIRLTPAPGLWRLRAGERAPQLLAAIDLPKGGIYSGFSARTDGRSFLWPQTAAYVSDIMLLERPR